MCGPEWANALQPGCLIRCLSLRRREEPAASGQSAGVTARSRPRWGLYGGLTPVNTRLRNAGRTLKSPTATGVRPHFRRAAPLQRRLRMVAKAAAEPEPAGSQKRSSDERRGCGLKPLLAGCPRQPRRSASRACGGGARALLLVSMKADRLSRFLLVRDTSSVTCPGEPRRVSGRARSLKCTVRPHGA